MTKKDIKIFEIYVKNPKTFESGWEIKYVRSTKDLIKSFPFFDCIISMGGCHPDYVDANWLDKRLSLQYRSSTKIY